MNLAVELLKEGLLKAVPRLQQVLHPSAFGFEAPESGAGVR